MKLTKEEIIRYKELMKKTLHRDFSDEEVISAITQLDIVFSILLDD